MSSNIRAGCQLCRERAPAIDLVLCDETQQAAFTREMLALCEAGNRSRDRTLVLPSEYLEVVIDKR